MWVLGLTGSIGMGKSTTGKLFEAEGVPVYDADAAVHRLYAQGGAAVEPLEVEFGDVVVDGAIDRDRLSNKVLNDPDAMKRLEAIVHPLVGASRVGFFQEAVGAGADIVVTASRSTTPLFSGDELKPGCFVAAIGSSLPHTRELDDRALERAARIAVEWLPQTLREAGDLVLARPGLVSPEKLVELGALVTGVSPGRQSDDEITLYKSVGVGLEDVALAGLAWQRVQAGA